MTRSPLLFLAVRSARNATLARLKRLREPRYLVGFIFAAVYFTLVIARPGRIAARAGGPGPIDALPPAALSFALLAVSAIALALLSLAWVFRRGSPALGLSESEAQFLFSAPLERSSVLHFALLRPQAGLLLGSLMLTIFSGRAASLAGLRTFLAGWLALSAFQFHLQAMAFWKARLAERPPALRLALRLLVVALAAAAVALTARWLLDLGTALPSLPRRGSLVRHVGTLWEGLLPWRSRFVPRFLLLPFRALLAPAFASDGRAFLLALPGALCVVLANYLWLVSTTVSWEEATLATAASRARRRGRKLAAARGIVLPGEGRRGIVPFRLAPLGRPEAALAWKSLLATGRMRISTTGIVSGAVLLLLVAVPAGIARLTPEVLPVSLFLAVSVASLGVAVGVVSAAGRTNDMRGDLPYAAVLRTWPLTSGNLVLGSLAVPWASSVFLSFVGLLGGAALLAGVALLPGVELPAAAGWGLAGGAAGFLLVPPLAALVLVVQNAAALAFPAWFASLGKRQAGFEQMGIRLFALVLTTFALALALLPGILLALPVAWFGREALGFAVVPVAALFVSLPAWGIVALGVALLARLWERYDPSAELPS